MLSRPLVGWAAGMVKIPLITACRPAVTRAVADQTALLSRRTELGFMRTSRLGPLPLPCHGTQAVRVPGHRWRLLANLVRRRGRTGSGREQAAVPEAAPLVA